MGLYKTLAKYGTIAAVIAGALAGGTAWIGHWTDEAVNLEGTVVNSFYSPKIGYGASVDRELCLIKAETDYGDKFVEIQGHGCKTLCDNLKQGDKVVFERVGEWAAKGEQGFEITPDRVEVK